MERIRVAAANMSPLLTDLVRSALTADAQIDFVASLAGADDLLTELSRTSTDVVLVGLVRSELPAGFGRVMTTYPHLKVLALSDDARHAFAFVLRPHRVSLGEASVATLASAIRSVAASEAP